MNKHTCRDWQVPSLLPITGRESLAMVSMRSSSRCRDRLMYNKDQKIRGCSLARDCCFKLKEGAHRVNQDFLYYEGCHRLGELTAHIHGTEAERDDFCRQQEINYASVVHLHFQNSAQHSIKPGTHPRPDFVCSGTAMRIQLPNPCKAFQQRLPSWAGRMRQVSP